MTSYKLPAKWPIQHLKKKFSSACIDDIRCDKMFFITELFVLTFIFCYIYGMLFTIIKH